MQNGQAYKFSNPFRGPYRVVNVQGNVAEIKTTDRPDEQVMRVAVSRRSGDFKSLTPNTTTMWGYCELSS